MAAARKGIMPDNALEGDPPMETNEILKRNTTKRVQHPIDLYFLFVMSVSWEV